MTRALCDWVAGLRPLHALRAALLMETISKLNRRIK